MQYKSVSSMKEELFKILYFQFPLDLLFQSFILVVGKVLIVFDSFDELLGVWVIISLGCPGAAAIFGHTNSQLSVEKLMNTNRRCRHQGSSRAVLAKEAARPSI